MSHPTLMKTLNTQFQHHLIRLKEDMTNIEYFTTTAGQYLKGELLTNLILL